MGKNKPSEAEVKAQIMENLRQRAIKKLFSERRVCFTDTATGRVKWTWDGHKWEKEG